MNQRGFLLGLVCKPEGMVPVVHCRGAEGRGSALGQCAAVLASTRLVAGGVGQGMGAEQGS